MHAENGLNLDLDQVLEALRACDVMVLGFMHLSPRVLFDMRPGPGGPLFRVVAPVGTPQERFQQLRKLRPGIGDPKQYLFLQWPLGLGSLLEMGVWERIVDRCREAAPDIADDDCAAILDRLERLDRKETREALRGDSYRTVWPPRRGRRAGGAE